MKAGVSTVPCGVASRPRRAAVVRSLARASNRTGDDGDTCASARGPTRLLILELQPQLGELLTDLVERRDAEILALHQLVAGMYDQLADGLDAELVHALAGPDREV